MEENGEYATDKVRREGRENKRNEVWMKERNTQRLHECTHDYARVGRGRTRV